MTVHEMSKLYYIKKLINRDTQRLNQLEARLQPKAANVSGAVKISSPKNVIEEITPQIIELKERIRCEREEYIKEQAVIEDYIMTVDNYQDRLILLHRFVDLMSWRQVARRLGGKNTADSVRKACYRFLKKN